MRNLKNFTKIPFWDSGNPRIPKAYLTVRGCNFTFESTNGRISVIVDADALTQTTETTSQSEYPTEKRLVIFSETKCPACTFFQQFSEKTVNTTNWTVSFNITDYHEYVNFLKVAGLTAEEINNKLLLEFDNKEEWLDRFEKQLVEIYQLNSTIRGRDLSHMISLRRCIGSNLENHGLQMSIIIPEESDNRITNIIALMRKKYFYLATRMHTYEDCISKTYELTDSTTIYSLVKTAFVGEEDKIADYKRIIEQQFGLLFEIGSSLEEEESFDEEVEFVGNQSTVFRSHIA